MFILQILVGKMETMQIFFCKGVKVLLIHFLFHHLLKQHGDLHSDPLLFSAQRLVVTVTASGPNSQ